MIVGSSLGSQDGGITMLNPDDAASPNRGNDGLGNKPPLPGGTASTFSQETLGGAGPRPEAAPSAPSDEHADLDHHETNVALALSEAADKLADANKKG